MGDRMQRLKGKAQVLKGKTKGRAGHASGSTSTDAKGAAEAVKGKTNQAVGNARSTAKKSTR
jgi:uncharacterized protein YjbJ (UPF0337 family)